MRKGRKEAFQKEHEKQEKELERYSGNNTFVKLPFLPNFADKETRTLRILPIKEYLIWLLDAKEGETFDDFAFPFVEVWKHFKVGKSAATISCALKYGEDRCPVCEEIEALLATNDSDDAQLAKDMKAKKQFIFIVLWKDAPKEEIGPYLWIVSPTWAELITGLLANPDYNDLDDPEDGHDLRVTRSGMKIDTKYTIVPKPKSCVAWEDREGELDFTAIENWIEIIPTFIDYGKPFLTPSEVEAILHGATVGDCLKSRETGDDPAGQPKGKEEVVSRRGRRRE